MRISFVYLCFALLTGWGNPIYEYEPINYYEGPPVDEISKYFESKTLTWSEKDSSGFLEAFLGSFNVPRESQVLVYSKTSLQANNINPRNPRAIYFNKDIYVAYVPGAKFLEIIVSSPKTGNNFYSFENHGLNPALNRETHNCLNCHGGSFTRDIPSPVVRSVYPAENGQPIFKAGTRVIDQEIDFSARFGGWYVSGTDQSHLGNRIFQETRSNVLEVRELHWDFFDRGVYPVESSDVIAHLILQHQSEFHRLVAHLNLQTQTALFRQRQFDKLLGRMEHISESTKRQIKSLGDKLLRYMFFVDEAKLPLIDMDQSDYARIFEKTAIKDMKGRSLQDLKLNGRMFIYPFSYMVYSDAFQLLPQEALNYIKSELKKILNPEFEAIGYEHLSKKEKEAIRQILSETSDLM